MINRYEGMGSSALGFTSLVALARRCCVWGMPFAPCDRLVAWGIWASAGQGAKQKTTPEVWGVVLGKCCCCVVQSIMICRA